MTHDGRSDHQTAAQARSAVNSKRRHTVSASVRIQNIALSVRPGAFPLSSERTLSDAMGPILWPQSVGRYDS
jgi:hypothetical protein